MHDNGFDKTTDQSWFTRNEGPFDRLSSNRGGFGMPCGPRPQVQFISGTPGRVNKAHIDTTDRKWTTHETKCWHFATGQSQNFVNLISPIVKIDIEMPKLPKETQGIDGGKKLVRFPSLRIIPTNRRMTCDETMSQAQSTSDFRMTILTAKRYYIRQSRSPLRFTKNCCEIRADAKSSH